MKAVAEVCDFLRSRPGKVRLRGTGSRSNTLPSTDAQPLDLTSLNAIERLDAGDQTCTVETGVLRKDLDAAVAEHDLELPCLGDGTIGGLFASDPFGPAMNGAQSPRSLLLGMEALLADGTPFRSGARVVKSVAGFDVHKALVGSNGRLFVAAKLHLRLKPKPRASQWFCNDRMERPAAIELLHALRCENIAPAVLQLRRAANGACAVTGRIIGRSNHVEAVMRRHALDACAEPSSLALDAPTDAGELVHGIALASLVDKLLTALPGDAPFTWLAGGRFEALLSSPATSDAFFARVPTEAATATVRIGANERLGHGTAIDPGQLRLSEQLKQALDPDDILV